MSLSRYNAANVQRVIRWEAMMHKDVQAWMATLPGWQRKVQRVLSFFGQDERGYNLFGFYTWLKRAK